MALICYTFNFFEFPVNNSCIFSRTLFVFAAILCSCSCSSTSPIPPPPRDVPLEPIVPSTGVVRETSAVQIV